MSKGGNSPCRVVFCDKEKHDGPRVELWRVGDGKLEVRFVDIDPDEVDRLCTGIPNPWKSGGILRPEHQGLFLNALNVLLAQHSWTELMELLRQSDVPQPSPA